MKLKVLIADKLSDSAVAALEELGAEVRVAPELNADTLASAIGDAEVLVVRSTKVSAATIDAAENLALVIRAGAGVNTIDINAASRRGIAVANCPGKNTAAVAELTIGLIIAADRRIRPRPEISPQGRWRKGEYGKAAGLKGRTLAILGLGAIGQAVAVRARALGMRVRAWSRSLTGERAEELEIERCASAMDAVRGADVVSVHLAAAPETKGICNDALFGAMKEGALFVNTSRSELVDTAALRRAIERRSVRAALDVFEDEPSGSDAAFADRSLVAMLAAATPHIGASTNEASEAIASEVVRIVETYLHTGKSDHAVNLRGKSDEDVTLVVRHYNRVGVLAGVLDVLRGEGVNVEEMENTIFSGGETASCSLKLDTSPGEAALATIRGGEHVIQAMLK